MVKRDFFYSLAIVLVFASFVCAEDLDVRHEREQEEKKTADYPTVPPAHLRDVMVFRLENKNFCVYTRLRPTDGISKIAVAELPGLCTVDVRMTGAATHPADPTELYSPSGFSFVHWTFDEGKSAISATTVISGPMNLQIAHDRETADGTENVSLVQSIGAIDGEQQVVRLNVSRGSAPQIALGAPDFATLRRQHPAETEKYLEPIFRELRAEGVAFSPETKLAWQVFAAEAKPDVKVNEQVQMVIHRLDADNFREREAASGDLKNLGEPAAVCLWKMDRSGFSAEQNSRIDAFLAEYQPATEADINRLRSDTSFLLECLYDTSDFVVDTALDRLRHLSGREIVFDNTLRDEQRHDAVNKLREMLISQTQPVMPASK